MLRWLKGDAKNPVQFAADDFFGALVNPAKPSRSASELPKKNRASSPVFSNLSWRVRGQTAALTGKRGIDTVRALKFAGSACYQLAKTSSCALRRHGRSLKTHTWYGEVFEAQRHAAIRRSTPE
jgi:hypothetical protein